MKKILLTLWSIVTLCCGALHADALPAVTHEVVGRLGDQLLVYCEALWVAHKGRVPFVARPFAHCEGLLLDGLTPHDDEMLHAIGCPLTPLKTLEELHDGRAQGTFFLVRYYPENLQEHQQAMPAVPRFDVIWEEPAFKTLLQRHIAPKQELPLLPLPRDRICVAVHVRLGTGVDPQNAPIGLPLKFPPIEWYAKQLQELIALKPHARWYVYLFTDDPAPEAVWQALQRHIHPPRLVNNRKVQIAYRQEGNFHNRNVLEDFFSMAQFDCIIRGMSNFSLLASKIGSPCLEVYPSAYGRRADFMPFITKTEWLWHKTLPRR